MDDDTTCTLQGVCRFLGPHPRHCSAIEPGGGGGVAAAGWPCVRALAHVGDFHVYGVPQGAAPIDADKVCGDCLHVWPAHLFECPQYKKNGSGAAPAPWPIPPWPNARRAPGRGVCRGCGHMSAHWIAAGQDVCSAAEPCGCEHYDPSPPPGSAPTSGSSPTSAPSSSSGPTSSAARAAVEAGAAVLQVLAGDLTHEEIALFDRYADRVRAISVRHGMDPGPDGAKLIAFGALMVRSAYDDARTARRPGRRGR